VYNLKEEDELQKKVYNLKIRLVLKGTLEEQMAAAWTDVDPKEMIQKNIQKYFEKVQDQVFNRVVQSIQRFAGQVQDSIDNLDDNIKAAMNFLASLEKRSMNQEPDVGNKDLDVHIWSLN
jgi:hypothetical protein